MSFPYSLDTNLIYRNISLVFCFDSRREYADLLAKEETVLQSMIDRLIEIGRCYGMEMNVEKLR
jgi:hypothetical protein